MNSGVRGRLMFMGGGGLLFMGGGGELLLLVRVMVWCGGEGSIVDRLFYGCIQ